MKELDLSSRDPRPNRLRILEEAAGCFAELGFRSARMEEIAARSGVSRALVYNYFKNKQGLLAGLQDHLLSEWDSTITSILSEVACPAEALGAWLRTSLGCEKRRVALCAIYADDAPRTLIGWDLASARAAESWFQRLRELLQIGVAKGAFREDLDVEATSHLIQALQKGLFIQLIAAKPGSAEESRRFIEAGIEMMLVSIAARDGIPSDARRNSG